MSSVNLDQRLQPDFNYTKRDKLIDSMIDMITCPIKMEITEQMAIFNNQCYDVQCFYYHRNQCHRKNQRRAQSNYTTNINIFKDPRTGTDFDYTFAVEHMYYRRLTQNQLRQIIVNRYPVLTFAQTLEFLPPWNGNMKVDEFVTHIKNLAELRQPERELYDEAIRNRQSVANNALPIQVIVPRSAKGTIHT